MILYLSSIIRYSLVMIWSGVCGFIAFIGAICDPSGSLFFFASRVWGTISILICNVKINVIGLEKLDPNKQYVFVSNHASMIDILAVLHVFPKLRLVFKKELSYIPIFGWALYLGEHIFVDRKNPQRAMKSLDLAASKIRSGGNFLLFAEGTRTRDGNLLPFKRGAFSLAVKAGVPVVPLIINGTFTIIQKGSIIIRPQEINLIVDDPIQTEKINSRDEEIGLMNKVREIMETRYIPQQIPKGA
ncbi:MAG: lysophospholipid acyltransferase family protein [Bacteroidetes bacterium]|nr:lysophospholipid acyltransferase family protein [Bacteroidota bacterium]